jgi:hypothetical protein
MRQEYMNQDGTVAPNGFFIWPVNESKPPAQNLNLNPDTELKLKPGHRT